MAGRFVVIGKDLQVHDISEGVYPNVRLGDAKECLNGTNIAVYDEHFFSVAPRSKQNWILCHFKMVKTVAKDGSISVQMKDDQDWYILAYNVTAPLSVNGVLVHF